MQGHRSGESKRNWGGGRPDDPDPFDARPQRTGELPESDQEAPRRPAPADREAAGSRRNSLAKRGVRSRLRRQVSIAVAFILAAALAAVLASVAIGQSAGEDPADPLALYDANENGVIDADEFIQATVDYFDGLIDGALAYKVWLLYAPPTRSVTTREWSDSCTKYDQNNNGVIERTEAIQATRDYFNDVITQEQLLEVLNCYYSGIFIIEISGLSGSLQSGGSDEFTVAASEVTEPGEYTITVNTSDRNIGFDRNCADTQEVVSFTLASGDTEHGSQFTLYACSEPGGQVTATLSKSSLGDLVTASQHVTVRAGQPPANSPPEFADGSSTTRSVPENTRSGQNIGNAVIANDPDGDTLSYSLSGTDASSFTVNESTGRLLTNAALDYETKSSYTLIVSASDGRGGADSITVTIAVADVNERPVVRTTISGQTLTVSGGSASIGLANKFSDPDGDTLTYTANSLNTAVVAESVSGSSLTISPVAAGSATVTGHSLRPR